MFPRPFHGLHCSTCAATGTGDVIFMFCRLVVSARCPPALSPATTRRLGSPPNCDAFRYALLCYGMVYPNGPSRGKGKKSGMPVC